MKKNNFKINILILLLCSCGKTVDQPTRSANVMHESKKNTDQSSDATYSDGFESENEKKKSVTQTSAPEPSPITPQVPSTSVIDTPNTQTQQLSLTSHAINANSVDLVWSAISNVTGYIVLWHCSGADGISTLINDNKYSIKNVKTSGTVFVSIYPCQSNGCSQTGINQKLKD